MDDLHPLVLCAHVFWSDDEAIPFDLACELVGLGYDVEALERQFHA